MTTEVAQFPDSYLHYGGDPSQWIHRNLAHRLWVRSLRIDFLSAHNHAEEVGDSIAELSELTHLSIEWARSLKCLPNTITMLHKLEELKVENCNQLKQLPPNLGELQSLTHLFLSRCSSIKSLPDSVTKLSNLTTLQLHCCDSLTELPTNWGQMKSLRNLSVFNCSRIKSLPNSVAKLPNLRTLSIDSLTELPVNSNLLHLRLKQCDSTEKINLPVNLREVSNLLSLSMYCPVKSLPSFSGLRNLKVLYLQVVEIPQHLDEMPQLLYLDFRSSYSLECLPWSITKLHKLQFLFLPAYFRLETLPFHLNDSVVISVEYTHIRKTWKELKEELKGEIWPFPFPVVEEAAQSPCIIHPSGYLQLQEDPGSWIQKHYDFRLLVRFLHVNLWKKYVGKLTDSKKDLSELTHLYISNDQYLQHLPCSITSLKHLSLLGCHIGSISDRLGQLSSLKSLDLILDGSKLPEKLDALMSLRCLTLRHGECMLYQSQLKSIANLSNLKTLNLYVCDNLESLPANLNLAKLKLSDSYISSLPTSLRHLEIIHSRYACDDHNCTGQPKRCLEQLVHLETLSLTCYNLKTLPSIAGLHNLRVLQLKDCFNLKELPSNLDELVQLCTLNISGTRIKSLPNCITKLPSLQHLILPKCFRHESLLISFHKRSIIVSIDDMPETYYKDMDCYDICFEDSTETANESIEITPSFVECDNYVVSNATEEGIIAEQTSPRRLLNLFGATQIIGDSHFEGRDSQNAEKSKHAFCSSQIQEIEIISPDVSSEAFANNEDMIAELSSNFQKRNSFESFDGSNQYALQNGQMGTMTLENEHEISSSNEHFSWTDERNYTLGGEKYYNAIENGENRKSNTQSYDKKRRQKKEIAQEDILRLMEKNMTQVDAGKVLGVSRSTMKRRCRELGFIEWPSSRKGKHHRINKMNCNTTKSPSQSELSNFNLENPTNPVDHEHVVERLDGENHQNWSEQVVSMPSKYNIINKSILNATIESVKEPTLTTQRCTNVDEVVSRCTDDAGLPTLSSNVLVPDSTSSSTVVVKATYKELKVKFKWSTNASLDDLKKAVADNLQILGGRFGINYQDEEKDWLLINTKEHLEDALSLIENSILRLKVIDL